MTVIKTKEYRIIRNLSISKLSCKSKIARSYSKYGNPGLKVICNLCKALQITPNELIDQELWKWW
ncbi:helix-turn-helix domain-containing protein [Clostridium botulinum]|uniref:helix-turn-helix domain-containing protein n=1 Tax=Clostridium botulinum TaxID=1491 RepID=UPI003EF35C3B